MLFNPKLAGKGVHTFAEGICPQVNAMAQLEFELAYFDVRV